MARLTRQMRRMLQLLLQGRCGADETKALATTMLRLDNVRARQVGELDYCETGCTDPLPTPPAVYVEDEPRLCARCRARMF